MQREIFTYRNLLNLPLQSQSRATSLALELLYIIINLPVMCKSHSETCRECLLWSPAVSISLINKTQQYGAFTRMQMSPDGECKLVCFTGRRCHRGISNPLKWGADQFFAADLGAKRERELTRCLIRSTTEGAGRGRHPHTGKNTYKTNACYATFPLRWDFFFHSLAPPPPSSPSHPVCFGESVFPSCLCSGSSHEAMHIWGSVINAAFENGLEWEKEFGWKFLKCLSDRTRWRSGGENVGSGSASESERSFIQNMPADRNTHKGLTC